MLYSVIVIKIILMDMNFQTSQKLEPKNGFFYLNLLIKIQLGDGFLVSQYVT